MIFHLLIILLAIYYVSIKSSKWGDRFWVLDLILGWWIFRLAGVWVSCENELEIWKKN